MQESDAQALYVIAGGAFLIWLSRWPVREIDGETPSARSYRASRRPILRWGGILMIGLTVVQLARTWLP